MQADVHVESKEPTPAKVLDLEAPDADAASPAPGPVWLMRYLFCSKSQLPITLGQGPQPWSLSLFSSYFHLYLQLNDTDLEVFDELDHLEFLLLISSGGQSLAQHCTLSFFLVVLLNLDKLNLHVLKSLGRFQISLNSLNINRVFFYLCWKQDPESFSSWTIPASTF